MIISKNSPRTNCFDAKYRFAFLRAHKHTSIRRNGAIVLHISSAVIRRKKAFLFICFNSAKILCRKHLAHNSGKMKMVESTKIRILTQNTKNSFQNIKKKKILAKHSIFPMDCLDFHPNCYSDSWKIGSFLEVEFLLHSHILILFIFILILIIYFHWCRVKLLIKLLKLHVNYPINDVPIIIL